MKIFALSFLVGFLAGCSSRPTLMTVSVVHSPRSDWVISQKREYPSEFAARYSWINPKIGIDKKTAWAIAEFYFYSTGEMCGAVFEPTKVGKNWRSEFGFGFAGTPMEPIWVDGDTGAVWEQGSDRIDDIVALIQTERPETSLSVRQKLGPIGP